MVFSSPKKHVANSIKKIGKGNGSRKVVKSLSKTLAEHPELMDDAVYQLVGIIQTDKVENFTYVIEVMLNIAEVEVYPLANSSDAITKILEFPEDSLDINHVLKTIDILGMIASRYPELLQSSVKTLLQKLNNPNSQIRSASFCVLELIAEPYPEYFSNYTLDLIRSLHSSYNDERLYTARLIGVIASIPSNLIDEMGELAYEYLDTMIRQETYDAVKEPKAEEKVTTSVEVQSESNDFGELADIMAESIKDIDYEESAAALLKSYGMEHLIAKPVKKKPTSKFST